MHCADALVFRENPLPSDIDAIRAIVSSCGCFSKKEIELAVELLEERLAKGLKSGYHFLFALHGAVVRGYSCFGPIPCTASSFDLYWIAVAPDWKGKGIGARLMSKTEERMAAFGASQIYIDTSSRPQYASARSFYLRHGYAMLVELPDFYDRGDGKVVFGKRLLAESPVVQSALMPQPDRHASMAIAA